MKLFISFVVLFFFFSCKNDEKVVDKKINIPNYQELTILDVPLPESKNNDWLTQHSESGQTFEQYLAKKPITVSEDRNVIYLQPIGKFTKEQQNVMDLNSEYIRLFLV